MNRILVCSLLILCLFASCARYQYPNAAGIRQAEVKALNNYYIDTTQTFVYRARLHVGKQDIKGSLVVKTSTAQEHRVALLSDLGQTLFDMTLTADAYEVHYAMHDLNKGRIMREVADIFRTMTQQRHANTALMFADMQHYYPVYVHDNCYYVLKERRVESIIRVKGAHEYFTLQYSDWNTSELPTKICIEHHRFPLQVELELDVAQSLI